MANYSFFNFLKHKTEDVCVKIFSKIKKNSIKILKAKNTLTFLKRCKFTTVYPKHIINNVKNFDYLYHPVNYKNNRINNFRSTLMKQIITFEIDICTKNIVDLYNKENSLCNKYSSLIKDDIIFKMSFDYLKNIKIKINQKQKNDHILKYNNLSINNKNIHVNEDWITNLTNIDIPKEIKQCIQYGSKYVVPIKNNNTKIISDIEYAIKHCKADELNKNKTRCKITNILSSEFNTTTDNHQKEIKKLMRNVNYFFKNNDLLLLNSDKSNKSVIMYKKEYEDKMQNILNDDSTYSILNTDPTAKIQTKNNNLVAKLKKDKNIDENTRKGLTVYNSCCPKIYGLPKIHKDGIPIRPIVSCINAPTYNLSKYLTNILNNVKNYDLNIKNSFELKNKIQNIKVKNNYKLMSFDVVSLFTSVPLELAVQCIKERWNDISVHTSLSKENFMDCLKTCLENGFCVFNNNFYAQKEGLAMGNPLSPIVSELVLDCLFNRLNNEFKDCIQFFVKFVDDSFFIVHSDKVDQIKKFLNQFHPRIKFTCEMEKDNTLNFLDVTIIRSNNNLKFKHYTKIINSGRFIHADSFQPKHYKTNTIKNLISRAFSLTSPEYHNEVKNKIIKNLQENGYKKIIINRMILEVKNKKPENLKITENSNKKYFVAIPYLGNSSIRIKRNIEKLDNNINVTFKNNNNNLKNLIFSKVKEKTDKLNMSNLIYKIDCLNCDASYVGETSQLLKNRINQHKRDVYYKKETTALCEHATQKGHCFNFDNVIIKEKESNMEKRKFLEMINIKREKNSINFKTDTCKLSAVYSPLL